jgi:hypothetical protein
MGLASLFAAPATAIRIIFLPRALVPKFGLPSQHPPNELRNVKGSSKYLILEPLFDLKFLIELAANGAGTSNRRRWSDATLEPAGRFAEPLDDGLGALHLGQPGLDVAQPCQIGLASLFTQGQLGIFQFPK